MCVGFCLAPRVVGSQSSVGLCEGQMGMVGDGCGNRCSQGGYVCDDCAGVVRVGCWSVVSGVGGLFFLS